MLPYKEDRDRLRKMLKDAIFKVLFTGHLLSLVLTDIPICLTWRQHNNSLQFVCRVPDLHLPVTLTDPANNELAVCLSPGNQSKCFPHISGVDIIQNLSTNETVFSMDKKAYPSINGNWTCQHGTHGDEASVEVSICNNGEAFQKLSTLKVYALWCAGIGIIFLPIEVTTVFGRYRGNDLSTSINWIMRLACKISPERKRSMRMLIIMMISTGVVIIVILTIPKHEDSLMGQSLCILFGIIYGLFVYIIEVSTINQPINRFEEVPVSDNFGLIVESEVTTESNDDLRQSQVAIKSGGGSNILGDIVVLGDTNEVIQFIYQLMTYTAEKLDYIADISRNTENTSLDILVHTYKFVFILYTENFEMENVGIGTGDIDKIRYMDQYPKIKIICKCRRDKILKDVGRIDLDFENNLFDDCLTKESQFREILMQLRSTNSR